MALSISLITPSYAGDFDACLLLCQSIDRFVSGYDMHYLVVGDEDQARFAVLAGPRRRVVSHRELLPRLWPVGRWHGRRYWWAPGLRLPIYGWHLQQLRKIAMALAQTSAWITCIDSDNCFARAVDLGMVAEGQAVPLYAAPGDIDERLPRHVAWLSNAHRLLGLSPPSLPCDDFIGQMVVWERDSLHHMTARIEQNAGGPWWQALARLRHFSEYLIYGVAVTCDPELAGRHRRVTQSRCLTYWSGPTLDAEALATFLDAMTPHHFGVAVQSHTKTPIELIRRVVLER